MPRPTFPQHIMCIHTRDVWKIYVITSFLPPLPPIHLSDGHINYIVMSEVGQLAKHKEIGKSKSKPIPQVKYV